MKILYIIPVAYHGGAERIALSLAEKMLNEGHEVKIIALKGPILLRSDFVNIQALELKNLLMFPFVFLKLLIIYYKFKPDIVHSHIFYSHIICRLMKIFYLKKHILLSSEHCTLTNIKQSIIVRILFKYTNFLSDGLYNVSKEGVLSYEKNNLVEEGKMKCIYNGVSTRKFNIQGVEYKKSDFNVGDDEFLFLAVGRLHFQKDYNNLLEALSYYKENFNARFKCLIVGEGPEEEVLRQKCESLDLSKNIDFLGVRDDVNYLMNLCDLYILSSLYEGLPTVLIEAIASPCLIAATDCGGAKEILEGIVNVVPIRDPKQLANQIHKIMSLPISEKGVLLNKSLNRSKLLFSEDAMKLNWYNEYLRYEL